MKTIYIVCASSMYEGGADVRAFEDDGDARKFASDCRAASARRPQAPALGASQAKWAAYYRAEAKWEKQHPANPHHHHEYFDVIGLDLYPKQK
ncbi:hypothetical protein Nazgul28 [Burkholderia phage BcepNazgul]|uniref:Uncharacterized protein n=1 Tax=Burkholderia phage BcepNazgul TaxID=242861 RepID=Q6UYL2_9CAUD|nr:hypothetical protein Nazgul28 [Burkholderia phage BcepNazgul]AAQ63329.1 conserved hypothetical protein [Burkholderia phage BcepNazgul]